MLGVFGRLVGLVPLGRCTLLLSIRHFDYLCPLISLELLWSATLVSSFLELISTSFMNLDLADLKESLLHVLHLKCGQVGSRYMINAS